VTQTADPHARTDEATPPRRPAPPSRDESDAAAPDAPGSAAPHDDAAPSSPAAPPPPSKPPTSARKRKPRHPWLHLFAYLLVFLVVLLIAARLALPSALRWYVNGVIDRNPLYDGKIGQIEVHLLRGAYTIDDVRLLKTTGDVPVPLFAAKRMDLAIQWDALLHGKVVGRVRIEQPELNFVAAGPEGDESQTQTGAGGPWLQMLDDLFPFRINRARIDDGQIHFRSYTVDPPFDVFLDHLDATVDDLTNIQDAVTPLYATVRATALAMGQARFEYEMKFDPFSYRPTFQLAVRLLGLDVTKINQFARAYGGIDFERGFFDLVVEIEAKEGRLDGYVKPLFRNLKVLSLDPDVKEDNILEFFWEGVVGVTTWVLQNPPRDQFGTEIPLTGQVDNPRYSVLEVIGNVLRNAFIRAYLPRLQGDVANDINHLSFGRGSIVEPTATGND
jgi:hypothetical protein